MNITTGLRSFYKLKTRMVTVVIAVEMKVVVKKVVEIKAMTNGKKILRISV